MPNEDTINIPIYEENMPEISFPQIYLAKSGKREIQGSLQSFVGQPMTPQTLDRITGVVEQMVAAAGVAVKEHRGRGFSTVPGESRLIKPLYLPNKEDPSDGTVLVRNLLPELITGKGCFVEGYHWDSNTGDFKINLVEKEYIYTDGESIINDSDDYESFIKKERFKWNMRRYLVIKSKTRGGLINGVHPAEITALDTLRELITEKEFRKYLKYGFLLVEGDSGDVYQVFRDKDHIKVWRKGILIEEICVYLDPSFKAPPTDKVIGFLTMIHASEADFKKLGNVYKMRKQAA